MKNFKHMYLVAAFVACNCSIVNMAHAAAATFILGDSTTPNVADRANGVATLTISDFLKENTSGTSSRGTSWTLAGNLTGSDFLRALNFSYIRNPQAPGNKSSPIPADLKVQDFMAVRGTVGLLGNDANSVNFHIAGRDSANVNVSSYRFAGTDTATWNFYNTQVSQFSNLGASVNLVLSPGTSMQADFQTITSPVPEPETYAMLLAGLGLVSFIARRKKQNMVSLGPVVG